MNTFITGILSRSTSFAEAIRDVEDSVTVATQPVDIRGSQFRPMQHGLRCEDDAVWIVHDKRLRRLQRALPLLADEIKNQLSVCYFCLHEMPFTVPECSHAICESCARASVHLQGSSLENDKRLISLLRCSLHPSTKVFENACSFQLKPKCSGVRIVTLDGGGVRGVIELKMLKAVQKALGRQIPLQRFFDLIGVTSPGGLISLGVGTKDWTLAKCEDIFPEICKSVFVKHGNAWSGDAYAYTIHGYRYQYEPLRRSS